STQCEDGHQFVFTNTSSISSGTMSYLWNFGDASSSTSTSPSHSYGTYGNYVVRLIATAANACADTVSHTMSVFAEPTAAFTINDSTQCFKGHSFVLSNSSSIATGTLAYAWTFGDGNSSTLASPTKTYTSAGNYSIRLIASSVNGCRDTLTRMAYAYAVPVVSFVANDSTQCFDGHSVTLSNNTTLSSGSMTHAWTFGDGNSSTSTSPTHSYGSYGNYTVKLVSTADNGCSDSTTRVMRIFPDPVAAYSVNDSTQCYNGHAFVITNNSSVASGSLSYSWDFSDGNSSTLASPTKTYTSLGTYTVWLIVNSSDGCSDTTSHEMAVFANPTASFTVDDSAQCFDGHQINLTNGSSISTGSLTHLWTFGDGNSSTSNNPSHTYASSGSYSVKLVSTGANACADSMTKMVEIYPQPNAAFTLNDSTQCFDGHSFIITNNSTVASGSMTYDWNFDDGDTSTAAAPTKSYGGFGNFDIRLLVSTSNGCIDSVIQRAYVFAEPTAAFSINDTFQCLDSNVFAFSDDSQLGSGSLSYDWNFGDGTTSSINSPYKSYLTPGNYVVRLIASGPNACRDTIETTVEVYPEP
ncbi:MAG: PKD domain-containing protein, partial [Bacteroidota bacterium]|nr:PKD domain-containing protein [Bacteroidota bacterium]MDX5430499.1 PKD domain-containing protein [Bacteroidota bacterium]MDX5469255.1 PKD domain-containing protein [Bacteroidota bacterium]